MDRDGKSHRGGKPPESEFLFQWGKRLRCVRIKNPNGPSKSNGGIRRKITTRIVPGPEPASRPQSTTSNSFVRTCDASSTVVTTAAADWKKSPPTMTGGSSPEKEERYYTTRGSTHQQGGGGFGANENGKTNGEIGKGVGDEKGRAGAVWPKIYITLSSKEKEEDFLAMKGCKPPQRPKKRAKMIQRTLLLVSPGAWLTDMCQERYEVREKKTSSRKRPRGLKAMGSMDSDSE